MITKRNGNGQTECVRCKEKGKYALNWDSFLYTFNDKPYCFYCLMEMLEEKDNIIDKAIEYLESYNTDFKNSKFGEAPISLRELGDLLDILRGEDNESN